jgi:hypothetical protein
MSERALLHDGLEALGSLSVLVPLACFAALIHNMRMSMGNQVGACKTTGNRRQSFAVCVKCKPRKELFKSERTKRVSL